MRLPWPLRRIDCRYQFSLYLSETLFREQLPLRVEMFALPCLSRPSYVAERPRERMQSCAHFNFSTRRESNYRARASIQPLARLEFQRFRNCLSDISVFEYSDVTAIQNMWCNNVELHSNVSVAYSIYNNLLKCLGIEPVLGYSSVRGLYYS